MNLILNCTFCLGEQKKKMKLHIIQMKIDNANLIKLITIKVSVIKENEHSS